MFILAQIFENKEYGNFFEKVVSASTMEAAKHYKQIYETLNPTGVYVVFYEAKK